jgi:hypothetical protein
VAYCPPELLDDLADVLAEVRTWSGVSERRPGVLSVRGWPFLHFHLLAGGRRRADIKGRADWVQLDLPRPLTAARRRVLVQALRKCHGEKIEPGRRAPRRSSDRRCTN